MYPDVLPTLSLLKDTYRLGLVTNGNTYSERCGLPGLFAFTIFAQDYQVPKPQPEFYERVLSETHTHPQEIIHVGDSLHNDVGGAQAVGFRAKSVHFVGYLPSTPIVERKYVGTS